MKANVAINGFGRIGRMVCRRAIENPDLHLVAINASYSAATLAHLLKYDTVHGKFQGEIAAEEGALWVNGHRIQLIAERDASKLPWADLDIDIVIEATGKHKDRAKAGLHLQSGARKVLITTASKDADATIVIGANEERYDHHTHHIIAAASCTTNCIAPLAKLLHQRFGILSGLLTTIHSYTNDQNILDNPHKDLRRARSGALAIIPTTTGAAKAVAQVLPELTGKMNGLAMRVPTPDVSVVDLVIRVQKPVTAEEVNATIAAASRNGLSGILGYSEEPLVSADYIGDDRSCIVDAALTMTGPDQMVKVVSWYDNEWGYSCRVVDVAAHMARAMSAAALAATR